MTVMYVPMYNKKVVFYFLLQIGWKKESWYDNFIFKDSFRKRCPYLWLVIIENLRSLEHFFFLSVPHPLFFQVCRTIFLCAKEMEIQVLDQNTMCIWSPNLMTPRGFFLLSLGIHNFVYMKSASKWKCSSQPKAKATRPNDHGIVAQHCEIGNGEFS